jgi:hypothetical protein
LAVVAVVVVDEEQEAVVLVVLLGVGHWLTQLALSVLVALQVLEAIPHGMVI